MNTSPTNRAQSEAKLIEQFQLAPEGSLSWECYQQAQYSWDDGVLDWVSAVSSAHSFGELYGMTVGEVDAEALVRNPSGHCDELIAIWRANWDHAEVPDIDMPEFWIALYWFGLKTSALHIAKRAGIPLNP